MLSLLRMALGMLLPEGAARRTCDTILGLLTLVNALAALSRLLPGWAK